LRAEPAPAEAEESLVEAAIAGDVAAFAVLYDRHLERVYRHVYYGTGNRADAEDLTQQVFLQAWQGMARFRRTGAPFIAWLLTIAHNLVVNARARGGRARPLDREPASEARWADPEALALARHDGDRVRQAIARLKPEQQRVIVLRFVERLDCAAIAAALGKSEGNVRVIQYRALVALRELLAGEGKG
jgi:RNA polymerase sigma-70 factor (ECF subfamily)